MEGRGVEETEGRGGERTGEGLRRSTSPISRDHLATGSSSSLEYLHTSCILPRAKTLAGQRGWGQGDTSSKAVVMPIPGLQLVIHSFCKKFWPPPSTPPLPFSHASPPLLSSFLPTHARLRVFPPLPSTWVGLRASGFRLIDSWFLVLLFFYAQVCCNLWHLSHCVCSHSEMFRSRIWFPVWDSFFCLLSFEVYQHVIALFVLFSTYSDGGDQALLTLWNCSFSKNWRTGHRYVQLFDEFGPIMLMLQSNLHFMATVWAQLPCQKT